MDLNRMAEKSETEYQFVKSLTLLDYEGTGKILKAVNESFLKGESVERIIFALNAKEPLDE